MYDFGAILSRRDCFRIQGSLTGMGDLSFRAALSSQSAGFRVWIVRFRFELINQMIGV